MDKKQEHTPTPWIVNKAPKYIVTASVMRETLDAAGGKPFMSPVSYPVAKAETAEDAAFIVRAVNSHEELIKALSYYATGATDGGKWAKQAIAKAEGI